MKVVFRTDASIDIGTGHVMRCLTLANGLRGAGAEVIFICRELPGHCIDLINTRGFEVVTLPAPAAKDEEEKADVSPSINHWLAVPWKVDAQQTFEFLVRQSVCDLLIVDHYGIDQAWEEHQKNAVGKLMVIDDLADRMHSCDVLLDQNLYANMATRYDALVPDNCQQLLGPDYVLLREEFATHREQMTARDGSIHNILVFFGGVDLTNMTEVVVKAIAGLGIDDVTVNIVIGGANPHRDKLQILCQQADNMQLHIQVSNMAEMMVTADLCVGAGGTATWERCCLGLPTLAWAVAENQQQLLEHAASVGLVYAPASTRPSVEEVGLHLRALLQNPCLCRHIGEQGMQTVDAQGVRRIINNLIDVEMELRPAEIGDMRKVYDWRNHIQVRKYSADSREIEFDTHQDWFRGVLEDPDRILLIGSVEGQNCGVLRYDIAADEAIVSIFLAPDMPGKGYGRALLKAGEKYLMYHRAGVSLIIADVMSDNLISKKLFESCGYVLNALQYQKRLD